MNRIEGYGIYFFCKDGKQYSFKLDRIKHIDENDLEPLSNRQELVHTILFHLNFGQQKIERSDQKEKNEKIVHTKIINCLQIFKDKLKKLSSIQKVIIESGIQQVNYILPILYWIQSLDLISNLQIRSRFALNNEVIICLDEIVTSIKTLVSVTYDFRLSFSPLSLEEDPKKNQQISYLSLFIDKDLQQIQFIRQFPNLSVVSLRMDSSLSEQTLQEIFNIKPDIQKLKLKLLSQESIPQNECMKLPNLEKFQTIQSLSIELDQVMKLDINLTLFPLLAKLSLSILNPVELLNSLPNRLLSLTELKINPKTTSRGLSLDFQLFPNITSIKISYANYQYFVKETIFQKDMKKISPIIQQLKIFSVNFIGFGMKAWKMNKDTFETLINILPLFHSGTHIHLGIDPDSCTHNQHLELAISLSHLDKVEDQLSLGSFSFQSFLDSQERSEAIQVWKCPFKQYLCLLAQSSTRFRKKQIQLKFQDIIITQKNEPQKHILLPSISNLFRGIKYLSIELELYSSEIQQEGKHITNLSLVTDTNNISTISFTQLLPFMFLGEIVHGWISLRKIEFSLKKQTTDLNSFLDSLEALFNNCKLQKSPKFHMIINVKEEMNSNIFKTAIRFFEMKHNFLTFNWVSEYFIATNFYLLVNEIFNSDFRFQIHLTYKGQDKLILEGAKSMTNYSQEVKVKFLTSLVYDIYVKNQLPINPAAILVDLIVE